MEVDSKLFPKSTNLNEYHNKGLRYRIKENGVFLIFPESDEEIMAIDPDELKKLREIYRPDYISLQKTLNVDLSKYWKFD